MSLLPDPDDLREDFVKPFYLKVMGTNALRAEPATLTAVSESGSRLIDDDVRRVLLAPWRPRVMGTWYAITSPRPALSSTLHESLRTSAGSLTSLALLVAVLIYPGPETMSAVRAYYENDVASSYGSDGLARAAAAVQTELTAEVNPLPPADAANVETFARLRDVALSLRTTGA